MFFDSKLFRLRLFLIGLLCLFTNQAVALQLDAQIGPINPVKSLQILNDPTGSLNIDQIRSPTYAHRFSAVTLSGDAINLGFTQGAYWIKLTLSRTAATPAAWLLDVPYQTLDHLSFFAPGKDPIITGSLAPYESREISSRFYTFPIHVETTPQDFYLRISAHYALTIPIELWLPTSYFAAEQKSSFIQAMYFGGLLALVIYNFLVFISLRHKSYFFYSLFGISMFWGIFAGNGYGRMYVWPNLPNWDQVAQTTCLSAAWVFGILFSNAFLKTKSNLAWLYRLLQGVLFVFIALTFTFPLARFIGVSLSGLFTSFALASLTTVFMLIAAGIVALRAGRREARFFLIAWGVLLAGGLTATLRAFDLVPSIPLTNYSVQISSAIEMLLLSFALADRIRNERQQREKAQQELLLAEQRQIESLKDSESKLEQIVATRTAALEESLANEKSLRELNVRFGAYVSHEFRNPLNMIESQVALFKRERQRNIDHGDERLKNIGNATHYLADLFERWLQSDHLSHTLTQAEPIYFPLNQWLADFVTTTQGIHPLHQLVCTQFEPETLCADQNLLKTALLNLIDNACKYAAPQTTVSIHVLAEADRLGISVADHGIGIAEDEQPLIYDAYFRCSNHFDVRGIGLGLAFVKQIMTLHDGEITLRSRINHGSTFTLWFPKQAAT